MLRSRSSGLLPITHSHSANLSRHDSRTYLGLRRRVGGSTALQRILTYFFVAVLLGGSVYGVARVGRGGGLAASADEFAIADELLDGGGGGLQRQQQQQQQEGAHGQHRMHVHEDVHDRRAAMEQQHGHLQQQPQPQAGEAGGDLLLDEAALEQDEQALLEQQHLAELQHLAEQQHGAHHGHVDAAAAAAAAALHEDPAVAAHIAAHIAEQQAMPRRKGPSLYAANLSAMDIHGNVVHTADLAGKVTVILNVASHCGYTAPNYQGLHRLYERYKDYGLQILAFPCNQFGQQEPGTHAEIEAFVAQHFGAQFLLMSKVDVNGPHAHPIFDWLKQHTPAAPGQPSGDVRWNFEKWLLDKYGVPVKRYNSDLTYHDLELDVYNELIKF